MPILIGQIKAPLGATEAEVVSRALKRAGLDRETPAKIFKTSLDARRRDSIHNVHSVYADLGDPAREAELCRRDRGLSLVERGGLDVPENEPPKEGRVVVCGFGPAGMFCALALAEQGWRPIVVERGEPVEKRCRDVERFWRDGVLSEQSNVQFGEGGAGTFSDGKLTTRINDPLCRYVTERLAEFGAPAEILTKAKPHIGTDRLRDVVSAIRRRIEELGGEVRFSTQLTDIAVKDGRIRSCFAGEEIGVHALVMAVGHSARDTFGMLARRGIFLEPKPFSVGARIEHLQEDVDESLYGEHRGDPLLPKGEYQLSHRDRDGRGVYTFCMCPGGTVVPASSELGGVVTNGMSEFARDGRNANSAVAVAVSPADFGLGALDGMAFAREIEQRAYRLSGGYQACGTSVGAFLEGRADLDTNIEPTYALGLRAVNYDELFPGFVTGLMRDGLRVFGRKMRCFADGRALLTGPETRTSSPVRMTRDRESLWSLSCRGLYPCGEGAGYAGGITSAAVDGLRVALKILGGGS